MNEKIIFNPGEKGEGEPPERPADGKAPVGHPIEGTHWSRIAPPSELTFEKTLESPAQAAAYVRKVDNAIHTLSLRLTSTRSQQLTEIEYALADEIEDQLTAEAEE